MHGARKAKKSRVCGVTRLGVVSQFTTWELDRLTSQSVDVRLAARRDEITTYAISRVVPCQALSAPNANSVMMSWLMFHIGAFQRLTYLLSYDIFPAVTDVFLSFQRWTTSESVLSGSLYVHDGAPATATRSWLSPAAVLHVVWPRYAAGWHCWCPVFR